MKRGAAGKGVAPRAKASDSWSAGQAAHRKPGKEKRRRRTKRRLPQLRFRAQWQSAQAMDQKQEQGLVSTSSGLAVFDY